MAHQVLKERSDEVWRLGLLAKLQALSLQETLSVAARSGTDAFVVQGPLAEWLLAKFIDKASVFS